MAWITPEIIAIVAVGVALGGLVIRSQHRLEDRLLAVEKEQVRPFGLLVWKFPCRLGSRGFPLSRE